MKMLISINISTIVALSALHAKTQYFLCENNKNNQHEEFIMRKFEGMLCSIKLVLKLF